MSTNDPISVLVLEEFRLHDEDTQGAAARIVAETPRGAETAIPLLTSVDDHRDVATLRALHADESTESDPVQHAALDRLVSSWEIPKHYGPRITERSGDEPSSYRLAVTESGINEPSDPVVAIPSSVDRDTTSHPIGLLWIGAPVGTHAGLLVLLGMYDGDSAKRGDDPFGWPLPLSTQLGVRIYESSRV